MTTEADAAWLANWLDLVASGEATMSQRALTSIEAKGGIEAAIRAAKTRRVHLVRLTDDRGKILVAASLHPFETLC